MSQQLVWYAIQRISTKRLLPAPPAKQRGGQTHASFEGIGPPRLYPTAAGANVAMKLWLRGNWHRNRTTSSIDLATGKITNKIVFTDSRKHLECDVHVIPVQVQIVENTVVECVVSDDDIC